MWVAPQLDGSAAVYSEHWQVLLHYVAPTTTGWASCSQPPTAYCTSAARVSGTWFSAWSSAASTRFWNAGEWHHVAGTWSDTDGSIRFFLDGQLMADTSDGPYVVPAGDGHPGHHRPPTSGELLRPTGWTRSASSTGRSPATRCGRGRGGPPLQCRWRSGWSPTTCPSGADIVFELAPSDGTTTGSPCTSDGWSWNGIPVTDPQPPSTLLPEGSTTVDLTVTTGDRRQLPLGRRGAPAVELDDAVLPSGAGGTTHSTQIAGLDPDPSTVNRVWVRTDIAPDFALELRYRSLGPVRPTFPKTGNLWVSGS